MKNKNHHKVKKKIVELKIRMLFFTLVSLKLSIWEIQYNLNLHKPKDSSKLLKR